MNDKNLQKTAIHIDTVLNRTLWIGQEHAVTNRIYNGRGNFSIGVGAVLNRTLWIGQEHAVTNRIYNGRSNFSIGVGAVLNRTLWIGQEHACAISQSEPFSQSVLYTTLHLCVR
ncbi:MAG: hypothetical protein R6W76_03000, partial [Caldilinea sp.]